MAAVNINVSSYTRINTMGMGIMNTCASIPDEEYI
jgi:hypothetical protein